MINIFQLTNGITQVGRRNNMLIQFIFWQNIIMKQDNEKNEFTNVKF